MIGVEECALLSTCNRVELVACGDPDKLDSRRLADALGTDRGLSPPDLRCALMTKLRCARVVSNSIRHGSGMPPRTTSWWLSSAYVTSPKLADPLAVTS